MRLIAALSQPHENDRLVSLATRGAGRAAIFFIAAATSLVSHPTAFALPALALVLLVPAERRTVLALAAGVTAVVALRKNLAPEGALALDAAGWPATLVAASTLGAFLVGVFLVASHLQRLPRLVREHPVACLHGVLWLALAAAALAGNQLLAAIVAWMPFLCWRLGHMLQQARRGRLGATTFEDHLLYLWPAFGGSNVPYGKGEENLSRCEARDAIALARSQLAGLKLLLLAVAWRTLAHLIATRVHGGATDAGSWSLGLPTLDALTAGESTASIPVAWVVLFLGLVESVLNVASFGHFIVGYVRLFGFNVFRGTYKPLLAESMVEFWNRYHFYFKELLVEVFFYPTFLRARGSARVRTFVAVFAAAFVGNTYFHGLGKTTWIIEGQWGQLWHYLEPRAAYCLLLALGIWISMMRQQALRARGDAPSGWTRWRRRAAVWLAFALLNVLSMSSGADLEGRTRFLLSLVGL